MDVRPRDADAPDVLEVQAAEADSWRDVLGGTQVQVQGVQMTPLVASWPCHDLSPNSRVHWAQKAKAKRIQRQEWAALARHFWRDLQVSSDKIQVSLEFYPPDRKLRDADNLLASCKAGLDGLADAMEVDDNRFKIAFELMDETVKGGCIKVRVGQ